MTVGEHRLKTKLAEKIAEWSIKMSETDDWADTAVYTHPDMEMHMADAAFAVFKAMIDSQAYLKSEG